MGLGLSLYVTITNQPPRSTQPFIPLG